MKKTILTLGAIFAMATTALAAPLNTAGIPTDAVAIIHVDNDVLLKSALNEACLKISEKEQANLPPELKKKMEEYYKDTGFDKDGKDTAGVTLAILNEKDNEMPIMVGVARGKYSAAKVNAAAKKKNVKTITSGKTTLINASSFVYAYVGKEELFDFIFANAGLASEDLAAFKEVLPMVESILGKFYFAMVDDKTIVFGEEGQIPKIISALTGKSYTAPAALTAFEKQTKPGMLMFVDGSVIPSEANKAGLRNIFFAFAEVGKNATAQGVVEFATEEKANEAHQQAQGMLAFLPMMLEPDEDAEVTPEQARAAEILKKVIAATKLSTAEKNLKVNIEYPIADLIKELEKAVAEKAAAKK